MKTKLDRAAEGHLVLAALHAAKPKPTKVKVKKIKVKKLDPDYWFSLCVRERAGWKCQACGKDYTPIYNDKGLPCNTGLHCSHYIGRANYSVRFDPINAVAHCYGCHAKFEGNPHNFMAWTFERLGGFVYDILIEKSNNAMLGKQARQEKQQIAEYYKSEFERITNQGEKNFIGYF
jgi:hypothetical protein